MTLRMEQVVRQLPALVERHSEHVERARRGIDGAIAALDRWASDVEGGDELVRAAMAGSSRPYAVSAGESPAARFAAPPMGAATVVAADGSSIEPDRFAPVPCYVVNVGWVVIPYGTVAEVVLTSHATVGPPAPAHEGEDAGGETGPLAWGVNLRRDAAELATGARVAAELGSAGDVVLLIDGTLFPWDLDSRAVAPEVRDAARAQTREALDALRGCGDGLSLGAYVSASRASDVVTSLAALGAPAPRPLTDGPLFRRMLGEGERSAVFRARSERGQRVEEWFPEHETRFFYLRVGGDVARVELPAWAATPPRLERLHATLVDQCRRCDGYPRALQEAHEQAVISAGDRIQFARLLESEAARQGMHPELAGKQESKRRRAV